MGWQVAGDGRTGGLAWDAAAAAKDERRLRRDAGLLQVVRPIAQAGSAIRVTLGRFTTADETAAFLAAVRSIAGTRKDK